MICDFAETYHILDWRGLPLKLAATLASGFPENSRSMRRLSGSPISPELQLLARITDYLAILHWWNTKDGKAGRNPPASVEEQLLAKDAPQPERDIQVFQSGEDFMRAYQEFMEEV